MKLDREALWKKYALYTEYKDDDGVLFRNRFHALLDDIERQRGEPVAWLIRDMSSGKIAGLMTLPPTAQLIADRRGWGQTLEPVVYAAHSESSSTGQDGPDYTRETKPVPTEPARSAEPQERETQMNDAEYLQSLPKDTRKLVEFFRSAEGRSLGRQGDHDNLSPSETAIRAMQELLAARERVEIITASNDHLMTELSRAREQIARQEEEIEAWQREFSGAAQRKD